MMLRRPHNGSTPIMLNTVLMDASVMTKFFMTCVGMVSTSTLNINTGSTNTGHTISVLMPGDVAVFTATDLVA